MANVLKKLIDYVSYQPPNVQVYIPAQPYTRMIPFTYAVGVVPAIYSAPNSGYYFRDTGAFDVNGNPIQTMVLMYEPNQSQSNQSQQPTVTPILTYVTSMIGINDVFPAHYETFTPKPFFRAINLVGWTGSAASIGSFTGNGHAEFSVLASSKGVVCGLVALGGETGSGYANITHGIHATQGTYQIIESGIAKTPSKAFTSGQVFTIQKQGTELEYLLDGVLIYKSLVTSGSGLEMVLDASLYSSGDSIINASIDYGVSAYGWKETTAIYVTGTGGSGGDNGVFLGTGSIIGSTGSFTGSFTGTVIVDGGGSHVTGTFTGTLTTIDGGLTWVFAGSGGDTGTSIIGITTPVITTITPPVVPEFVETHFYEIVIDKINYSDNIAQQSQYTLSLTDTICYSDYIDTGKGKYIALTYSPETKSTTTYSNMPFDGSCVFYGKTLFFNESGLYEYGGLTDNGIPIVPSLKTGKMDTVQGKDRLVHSNKIKRIPNAKIKVSCDKVDGTLDLYVTTDNDAPDHYEHAIEHDGFATHDVKIGRGTKLNNIQLEITAHGCSKLDINNIELDIVENVRSER